MLVAVDSPRDIFDDDLAEAFVRNRVGPLQGGVRISADESVGETVDGEVTISSLVEGIEPVDSGLVFDAANASAEAAKSG